MSATRRFLFLLGSTRRRGNSEQLAHLAARSMPTGATAEWLFLMDYPLPPFVDHRHGQAYPPPTDAEQTLLAATLRATDIVLVSPLYWYSMSVPLKHYLDYWSAWLRISTVNFRNIMSGKTLWAVVASAGSAEEAAPLRQTLQLSAVYMHMHWGGFLLGNGSRPGDVLLDTQALREATHFFAQP